MQAWQVIDQIREKIKSSKASVVILDFASVPAIDATCHEVVGI